MIENPNVLIGEFVQALSGTGRTLVIDTVAHDPQAAPHKPHALPMGKCAVYVFSLSDRYGSRCPAGANRVLKVNKAGPTATPVFFTLAAGNLRCPDAALGRKDRFKSPKPKFH